MKRLGIRMLSIMMLYIYVQLSDAQNIDAKHNATQHEDTQQMTIIKYNKNDTVHNTTLSVICGHCGITLNVSILIFLAPTLGLRLIFFFFFEKFLKLK
jgi:hypothetical protein